MNISKTLNNLTGMGYCPSLHFNDDGYWALSCDGVQCLNAAAIKKNKPFDLQGSFYIEKQYFKKTIEEAITYYLKKEDLLNLIEE